MPEQDPQFYQLLDQLQQTWTEAQTYSHWDPPVDGQYAWRFEKIQRGVRDKDSSLWWSLHGTLEYPEDPSLNGKDWRAFFFSSKNMGFLKEFFITAIGEWPNNVKEADAMLEKLLGGLYIVELKTQPDKNGVDRRNTTMARPVELPDITA